MKLFFLSPCQCSWYLNASFLRFYVPLVRSKLWEMELEMKEMKFKLTELVTELQQIEAQRKETLKEQKLKDQAVAIALAISSLVSLCN